MLPVDLTAGDSAAFWELVQHFVAVRFGQQVYNWFNSGLSCFKFHVLYMKRNQICGTLKILDLKKKQPVDAVG